MSTNPLSLIVILKSIAFQPQTFCSSTSCSSSTVSESSTSLFLYSQLKLDSLVLQSSLDIAVVLQSCPGQSFSVKANALSLIRFPYPLVRSLYHVPLRSTFLVFSSMNPFHGLPIVTVSFTHRAPPSCYPPTGLVHCCSRCVVCLSNLVSSISIALEQAECGNKLASPRLLGPSSLGPSFVSLL